MVLLLLLVFASRLTCCPDAPLGLVFVLAVSKFWSTTCVFLEFLSISSLLCLFVLAVVLIFACVAILLFSGPKLEVLLFFSTFYAGRAVSTAFSRAIGRFFVAVSVLSQSILRGVSQFFVAVTAFLRVIRRLLFLYFREHPCSNHGNVQIRLHPFPQSIHERPDQTPSIPAEHPCASHEDQTPSIPAEHPCANHDNVQIRLHPFPQSIHMCQP